MESQSAMTLWTRLLGFLGTMALTFVCVANPIEGISSLGISAGQAGKIAEQATSRGRFKAGGSAGLMRSGSGDGARTSFAMTPSLDVFVLDRFSVGLDADVGFFDDQLSYRSIRPALAYYFFRGDELAVFFRQDVGFTKFQYEDLNLVSFASRLGLDWFLGRNVALTPFLAVEYGGDKKVAAVATRASLNIFF